MKNKYIKIIILSLFLYSIFLLNKENILKVYLKFKPAEISELQKENFENWIEKTLVSNNLISDYCINCTETHKTKFIILNQTIPFVIDKITWNAAYDSDVNAVFIGKDLFDFGIDFNGEFTPYWQLCSFIILHEIGHKNLGHNNRRQFDSKNLKRTKNNEKDLESIKIEKEADKYALDQLKKNADIKDTNSEEKFISSINKNLFQRFITDALLNSNFKLSSFSSSHPNIVERCSDLLTVMESDGNLSEKARNSQKVLSSWFSKCYAEVKKHLVCEIKAPNNLRIINACTGRDKIYFLLENGYISMLNKSKLSESNSSEKTFITLKQYGDSIDVERIMLHSGSIIWESNEGVINLLLPKGKLYESSKDTNWKWKLNPLLNEIKDDLLVDVVNSENKTLIITTPRFGSVSIKEISFTDSFSIKNIFQIEDRKTSDTSHFSYKYAGFSSKSIFIQELKDKKNSHFGMIESLIEVEILTNDIKTYSYDLSNEGRRNEIIVPIKERKELLFIYNCNKRICLTTYKIGSKEIVSHEEVNTFLEEKKDKNIYSIGTNLFGLGSKFSLYSKAHKSNIDNQIIFHVQNLGTLAYDYNEHKVLVEGTLNRSEVFFNKIDNTSLFINFLYGGERAFIWNTKQ